jgi:hypothetical protein
MLISPFPNFLYFLPLGTNNIIDKVFLSFLKGALNEIKIGFDWGYFILYFLSS